MSTFTFSETYVAGSGMAVGPFEKKGPLGHYFTQAYADLYCGEKSFEKAEQRLLRDAIEQSLSDAGIHPERVAMAVGGDLLNQGLISNYTMMDYPFPFVNVYGACSTSALAMGMACLLLNQQNFNYTLAFTSSHYATAERQFRFPNEYGAQKKATTTTTVSGAGAIIFTKHPQPIKVISSTFGKVVDWQFKDSANMGVAMAPAAYDTLLRHFKNTKTTFDDYDLILTGDLSKLGNAMLSDMLKKDGMDLKNKLNDCGLLIYDILHQNVFCGGSGCACSMITMLSKGFDLLRQGKAKRILLVATGALLTPVALAQKGSIPCIAHAICFERSR